MTKKKNVESQLNMKGLCFLGHFKDVDVIHSCLSTPSLKNIKETFDFLFLKRLERKYVIKTYFISTYRCK